VRVNATSGQLARAGDKTVIYEAFKPGTEPNGEAPVVVSGASTLTDDEDAASMGVTAGEAPIIDPTLPPGVTAGPLPPGVTAAPTAAPGVAARPPLTPTTSAAPRAVPATGTGGLY